MLIGEWNQEWQGKSLEWATSSQVQYEIPETRDVEPMWLKLSANRLRHRADIKTTMALCLVLAGMEYNSYDGNHVTYN